MRLALENFQFSTGREKISEMLTPLGVGSSLLCPLVWQSLEDGGLSYHAKLFWLVANPDEEFIKPMYDGTDLDFF